MKPLPGTVLTRWEVTSPGGPSIVMPDGCRDLIGYQPPGGAPRWFLTGLDSVPRPITAIAGARFVGYRLRPGAVVDPRLGERLGERDLDDGGVLEVVAEESSLPTAVSSALEALASAATVAGAVRDLGGTERGLQRLLRERTGWSPSAWRSLARSRSVVTPLVARSRPLAEVAADGGYADQPHLTREVRRWFGVTPAVLRRTPERWPQLFTSGYAAQPAWPP